MDDGGGEEEEGEEEEVEGEAEEEGDAEEEGEEASDEDDDRARALKVLCFFWLRKRARYQREAFRRWTRNARKGLLKQKNEEEKKTVATVPQAARAAELHASDKDYKLIAPKRWWPK